MKIATKTAPQLVAKYRALRAQAAQVDQSTEDKNRNKDYVTVRRAGDNAQDNWDGGYLLNSYPRTSTKLVATDPLVSRKEEVKGLGIQEQHFSTDPEHGQIRREISFEDDGRILRAKESVVFYDDDNFLASSEQSYIIYQKSGKMRTLKPRQSGPPLG